MTIFKEGALNTFQIWAATHLRPVWWLVERVPPLRKAANRLIIDLMISKMKTRPLALSTMSPYTSWASLTDRRYSDRHLPPGELPADRLPPIDDAAALFELAPRGPGLSKKSTLLFPHFAQWFVDGFLRTDPADPRKNTSTHEIDLSQLYGQTADVTAMLRSDSGGRLKSQVIDGEEYPPFYFGSDGNVKPEFENLPITYPGSDRKAVPLEDLGDDQRRTLFALGIARGNIHYGFAMMSTLWLREHNRVADAIAAAEPDWDDERLFQTARNVMIVLLMKVVVEDYINHITPFRFRLFVDPGYGGRENWYRENWMSVEFNLLYRWHSLVPERIRVRGQEHKTADVLWTNRFVIEAGGLAALFDEASRQPSGEIGLLNTPGFLLEIEKKTLDIGRTVSLASYNDYREACTYPRMKSFADVSSSPEVQARLRRIYRSVDDIELYVGLFAEDVQPFAALPTLMGTMVGGDAFSQALTNPLLSSNIFKEGTFSSAGMKAIRQTRSLSDIVSRNVPPRDARPLVTLTQEGWRH